MKRIVFLVLIFTTHFVLAQKFSVRGELRDSLSRPLPSATVVILQSKDSSLVNFGVSDAKGLFEIKNLAHGDYLIRITYLGFRSFTKKINPPAGTLEVNVGQIRLTPRSSLLGEIVIKGEKPPVVVKRDTIEFNAESFKTKINGTAEDLIKKLPGVEVDNDGTIRAQGETVQRVMVDGKEFFGQDPKLATRNLPADAVDKVQIYEKKSDQTVFSGIDDGQREKTINLELKEEKRHASFGNDMAGAGTDGRFQAKASVNRFEKGNQVSFLGMANNINEQGFSIGDYTNFGGSASSQTGAAVSTGRQNGIVTNYAGGLNANQTVNQGKTKINASYFYNYLDQNLKTVLQRVNYLPTGNYNFDQTSYQNTTNNNNRANITVEHKIDTANSIKGNANFTYNIQNQPLQSKGMTYNVGNTALSNESNETTTAFGNNATLVSNLLVRHRFRKKGRTLSTNFTFGYTESGNLGTLQSINQYFTGTSETQNVSQTNTQTTVNPSFGISTSYSEPLGGRKYLEMNYSFSSDINSAYRYVYNVQNEQTALVDSLSNKYHSDYVYSRPGLNLRINRDNFNFAVGTAWQETWLKGFLPLPDQRLRRLFQAVLPSLRFNYDFSNFRRMRFDYSTSMQEPTIQQLQPVVNNIDQLNLSTGNPLLKPAYSQQLRSNFTSFDPSRFMNFFALITGNYTTNAIVSSQSTTPQFIRITKPVNTKNSSSLTGNFNVGVPLKSINSRFNIGPNYSISRSINLINDVDNFALQQTLGSTARYNYTLKEILIVDLGATLSHQETKYSFKTQQNQVFFNKTYTAEVNVNFLKNYAFNTEMDYFIYTSASSSFYQTIPLWNMSVSRFLLKNKTGELKFVVNNLLNKSLSVTQTASTNYLQQQTNNNLGRFFMITFTYALNKQLNPMNGQQRRNGFGGNRMFRRG